MFRYFHVITTMTLLRVSVVATISLCGFTESAAQVVINEACSKNVSVLADGPDNFRDWIEVHNAGASTVDLATYFLSDDADDLGKWQLPQEQLAPGGFLVLFEGNDNGDDHHFNFKLAQEGGTLFLSNASLEPVSELVMPWLRFDHTYGRWWSAPGTLYYYTTPTPGAANNTTGYRGYAATPLFDREPGFHASGFLLNISGGNGTTVRYTTDGREPDAGSPEVVGGISVNSTGTVKASATGDSLIRSATAVCTYLIDEPVDLPVVSLSMHPDSMFHEEFGLYMLGPEADTVYPHWGANFWDERGIPVHFEYFDEQHVRRVLQEVELRIHGGRASRNMPQRPLRLTARDEYGDDLIRYPFFKERPDVGTFKRIILRNSGADWCLAHYRDGLFHQVSLHNELAIDELGFEPSVVFINGQYWGILNIRERIDEDHLSINYGADRDDLLIMEEENFSIQGDSVHFHELKEFIYTHDMNDPVHFAHVDSLLDLDSFMDYFALEMFAGNADWPTNNLKYWKPSITEGKWRYVLYDMDATMNVVGWIPMDFDMFYWVLVHRAGSVHAEIYRSLMGRNEFKRGFLNRLADLMNTSLSSERFNAESERIKAQIRSEVERHFTRWNAWSYMWYLNADTTIPAFAQQRPDIMRQDVLEWYQLPNTATLRFEVYPPQAGVVHINTIEPAPPFTGVYFNGNDIDITALAAAGFQFDHWEYSGEAEQRPTDVHLRRSFASDGTITAWFQRPGETFTVFPNPWTETLDVTLHGDADGRLTTVTLADATGRLVHRSQHLVGKGMNRIQLGLPQLAAGVFTLEAEVDGTRRAIRVVKVQP